MGACSGKQYEAPKNLSEALYESVVAQLPPLEGKVVAVTGSTTGLGFYWALAAARKGPAVILMLNRPSDRARQAEEKVQAQAKDAGHAATVVRTIDCDLQDLASVRRCAEEVNRIVADRGGLDVLANNAGIMAMPDTRTKDGYDVQMQTCHLSHVLLTKLVFHQLERAAGLRGQARIVFHSSSARDVPSGKLRAKFFCQSAPGTLGGESGLIREGLGSDGPWQRYHQTKLANAAYAMALHEKLTERGSKVKCMAVDPGLAASELQVTSTKSGRMPHWAAKTLMGQAQSAADGSTCLVLASFGADVDSGDFYAPKSMTTGPPKKVISKGAPVKKGGEKNVCNKANIELAWVESNKIFAPADFFG